MIKQGLDEKINNFYYKTYYSEDNLQIDSVIYNMIDNGCVFKPVYVTHDVELEMQKFKNVEMSIEYLIANIDIYKNCSASVVFEYFNTLNRLDFQTNGNLYILITENPELELNDIIKKNELRDYNNSKSLK